MLYKMELNEIKHLGFKSQDKIPDPKTREEFEDRIANSLKPWQLKGMRHGSTKGVGDGNLIKQRKKVRVKKEIEKLRKIK